MRTTRTAVSALLLAAFATLTTACSSAPYDGPSPPRPTDAATASATSSPTAGLKDRSPAARACADALNDALGNRLDPDQEIVRPSSCDRLSKDEYGQEYADALRDQSELRDIMGDDPEPEDGEEQ
ncbi:hypothetical protein [Streptomyces sp. NPDC051561]|uniref:hypothetical protein n=1 Tax=Streptomyces sp. NPDC051561 TaxID=3365658 RepID=UPI0037964DC9